MSIETLNEFGVTFINCQNVLGEDMQFIAGDPSDNSQNYVLNTKYLTKDCTKCRNFITKETAEKVVQKATEDTPHKWTPPKTENIEGICCWGKYNKVLVVRPKGSRHCEFVGKKTGEKRWPLVSEE